MTRPTLFLAAAGAILALAACDKPSTLTKAQVGDCYQVMGKDSLGEPHLAKTACSTDGAAPTAAAGDTAQTAPDGAVQTASSGDKAGSANAAVCVKAPVCAGSGQNASAAAPYYIATSSVRSSKTFKGRRFVSRNGTSGDSVGQGFPGLGLDYARATEASEAASAKGQSSASATVFGQESGVSGAGLSSAQGVRRTVSEQTSTSYSSSSSSSETALAGGPCCTAALHQRAPGPNPTFDENGFLTWPGKVAYQPQQPRR